MLFKEKKEKKVKKKKVKGYICSIDRYIFFLVLINLKFVRVKIIFCQKKNMYFFYLVKKYGVKRFLRYLKIIRSFDKFLLEIEKMFY